MRLTSPVAVLVLLAVGGCGGTGDAFTEDYNRAVRPVAQVGGERDGGPDAYDRLAREVRKTTRKLARLTAVPEGARDELDRLEAQLGRVASRLEAVATAQRQKDPKLQKQAASSLRGATRDFKRAEDALQQAVEG